MNLLKLLVVVALGGLAYHAWNKHHGGVEPLNGTGSAESRHGFVALPPVAGASTTAVLVIAAENCPEEAAQRADRLAEQIAQRGVPVARLHSVSFEIPDGDPAVANRIMSIMNSELPIVVVRGRAKSNPTLDDAIAEYEAARL
jgi:hypothetical protein